MTDTVDVEACVRLLKSLTPNYERAGGRFMFLKAEEIALAGALASALPGMGKALDLVRDCPRCQGYLRSGRLTLAQSEREAQSVLDRLSAARAAQPQETSDAG